MSSKSFPAPEQGKLRRSSLVSQTDTWQWQHSTTYYVRADGLDYIPSHTNNGLSTPPTLTHSNPHHAQ